MTENIGLAAKARDPLDDAQSGQPLWYWALSREGRQNTMRDRARAAGTTYGEDISAVGCLPDGSPPEKARREYNGPKLRMSKRRRAAIEARAKELLGRRK